jgi:hypothetical protein
MSNEISIRVKQLGEAISAACRTCEGRCCKDYYPLLLATGFARTKKRLILDPGYRNTFFARLEEMAHQSGNKEISAFIENLHRINFAGSPLNIITKLSILDKLYESCSPKGPCVFFWKDQCLIQETKEFRCEGYYCGASSYNGASGNLQLLINENFTGTDLFNLHLKRACLDDIISLIELELTLFEKLPRLDAARYIAPKIILASTEAVSEISTFLKGSSRALPQPEVIAASGDHRTLNKVFFQYFSPDFFSKNLRFLLSSDLKDLSQINRILLHQIFPTLLFLSARPERFYDRTRPFLTEKHYTPARFDLYLVK